MIQADITKKDDYCPRCGAVKHVQVTRQGAQPTVCAATDINRAEPGVEVQAMWCSWCGVMYHPSSGY